MSFAEVIQTIEDMEKLYYSQQGRAFLNADDLLSPFVTKADAPVITTTTGVYNAIYGAQGWVQLNMEANTFGVLPKLPWGRSGWRAITVRSSGATAPTQGGAAEAGTLPDTVKPTFQEVSTKPKTHVHTFENSEVQEFLATQGGDDAFAAMSDLRTYMATEHKEGMNYSLNDQNGTLASTNFETIDRVVGSYAEITNTKENDQSTGYTTGDLDIYSLDRDAQAAWHDAYVNYSATSGSTRSLTDAIIQATIQNTLTNGANPKGQFWQTGYDTWAAINQLYDPQVRYNLIGSQNIQPGVNGIQTLEGTQVGTQVATLMGRAVIISKDTTKETSSGGISRLYLLDTSNPEGFDLPRLCLKIAKPTQYFEAGMNTGTPFAVGKLTTKGMYRTMGELICTFFAAQGKARDLNT